MKAQNPNLTREQALQLFSVCPNTGDLLWRVAPNSRAVAGQRAGTITKNGYVRIELTIEGKRCCVMAHRLVWLLHTGAWPSADIDHRDNCRRNNKITNLRQATNSQNQCNTKLRRNNSSGHKGITWNIKEQKWVVTMGHGGKPGYIGIFNKKEDAIAARLAAEKASPNAEYYAQ
jgi:hypothetical protein